jgi:hypothetical protein
MYELKGEKIMYAENSSARKFNISLEAQIEDS